MNTDSQLQAHGPDVLSCLANLSSDEIFTSPALAKRMLDDLAITWKADHDGANIWENRDLTFLDPCAKSGVFLREITKRLVGGLAREIPDLQERVDHILTKQVYGIAISNLTSMVVRRSVYCSKNAKGNHSITKKFATESGNIWFERTEHSWQKTKCKYCHAKKSNLERDKRLENYAYAFIHTSDIKAWVAKQFGGTMKFDIVIGNPPYHMKGGSGGTSDSSIYQLFVKQAQQLGSQYISMVIPSRWLAGGRRLDEFRNDMLKSGELAKLVDFPSATEIFPDVQVKGGVCYFLLSKIARKKCDVTIVRGDNEANEQRNLGEFDIFIRNPKSAEILRKVLKKNERSIKEIMTSDTPFGLATNFNDFRKRKRKDYIALHYVHSSNRGIGYVSRDKIQKGSNLIDMWKVLVPSAGSPGGSSIPDYVLGKPWLSRPPSVSTQTFLAFCVDSEEDAQSVESYYRTKFFRHLVSLRKITQHGFRKTYTWVPLQKWDRIWTDRDLYAKYNLTSEEIEHIEATISPMPPSEEVE